jgi:hypothetical protein
MVTANPGPPPAPHVSRILTKMALPDLVRLVVLVYESGFLVPDPTSVQPFAPLGSAL